MAINLNPAAVNAAVNTTAATGLVRQTTQVATPVLINLSPLPALAKVVREGFQVPAVALNPAKANFFIDNLAQIDVRQEPRVVSQSVPAGTKVLPGQAVDLVLALTRDIPINIFELPHRDLKDKALNVLTDGLLQDTAVRQTLLKYATPAEVPGNEKTALVAQFAQQGINVDEGNADTGFAAAFNTARGALAFR